MSESDSVLLVRIDERVKTLVDSKDDHEKRIRGLEKTRLWALAIVSLCASALGFKINFL